MVHCQREELPKDDKTVASMGGGAGGRALTSILGIMGPPLPRCPGFGVLPSRLLATWLVVWSEDTGCSELLSASGLWTGGGGGAGGGGSGTVINRSLSAAVVAGCGLRGGGCNAVTKPTRVGAAAVLVPALKPEFPPTREFPPTKSVSVELAIEKT